MENHAQPPSGLRTTDASGGAAKDLVQAVRPLEQLQKDERHRTELNVVEKLATGMCVEMTTWSILLETGSPLGKLCTMLNEVVFGKVANDASEKMHGYLAIFHEFVDIVMGDKVQRTQHLIELKAELERLESDNAAIPFHDALASLRKQRDTVYNVYNVSEALAKQVDEVLDPLSSSTGKMRRLDFVFAAIKLTKLYALLERLAEDERLDSISRLFASLPNGTPLEQAEPKLGQEQEHGK